MHAGRRSARSCRNQLPNVQGFKNASGSPVWAFSPCHPNNPNPLQRNEAWAFVGGTLQEVGRRENVWVVMYVRVHVAVSV